METGSQRLLQTGRCTGARALLASSAACDLDVAARSAGPCPALFSPEHAAVTHLCPRTWRGPLSVQIPAPLQRPAGAASSPTETGHRPPAGLLVCAPHLAVREDALDQWEETGQAVVGPCPQVGLQAHCGLWFRGLGITPRSVPPSPIRSPLTLQVSTVTPLAWMEEM